MGTPRAFGTVAAEDARSRQRVAVTCGGEEVSAYELMGTVGEALDRVEDHLRFKAMHSEEWRGRFVLTAAGGTTRKVDSRA